MESTQSVISPIGSETVKPTSTAPRLDTLNGKTICELWNEDFKGDIMFPIYRELLKERFPDVKVVPYTACPMRSSRCCRKRTCAPPCGISRPMA